jgi:hypothetical protein
MPKFTLDLSEAAVAGLQKLVARYNGDNGTQLTVADFLLLHVKEMSVQTEILEAAKTLREQAERDIDAAFKAERERLLASI